MPRLARFALLAVAVAAAVVLLFTVVFPWVDGMLADPTMGMLARLG